MTPLRQRMTEDMQRRNFSDETQRSYTHYIAEYARHFSISPDQLAPEAIREYQLFLTNDRKMSPQSVNCFTAAAKFLYQTTLEMPWSKPISSAHGFPKPSRSCSALPKWPSSSTPSASSSTAQY